MSKILAVGDVHTKAWIFDLVRQEIDNYDTVIFCGDFADNWGASASDTINTWLKLKELMQEYPKVQAVRGNHDYIYTEDTPSKQSGYSWETQAILNNDPELKQWVRSLPLILIIDGVTYSHAGIDETWSGFMTVEDMWESNSPIWIRPYESKYKQIPQVFGHTPLPTCTELEPNIWCIDSFSQYQDGSPIGDGTMLRVVNGNQFQKIKINANHYDTTDFEDQIS